MKVTHTTMYPRRKSLRFKTLKEFLGGMIVMAFIIAAFFVAAVIQ